MESFLDGEAESEVLRLSVPDSVNSERLDRFLPLAMKAAGHDVSRAILQGWIKEGVVLVNDKRVKPRHAVSHGDRISISIPEEKPADIQPEAIDIAILYEDDDIVVVNKSHGLVVHPASGNLEGTLVNALLHHCDGQLCSLAGDDRPGLVHRLDKDTSGCLVAVKSEVAYHSLVSQFSGRETGKVYQAVTAGVPANSAGTIVTQIGRHPVNRQKMAVVEEPAGKEAITDYRILRQDPDGCWTRMECVIHTGRTHQIRVHLKECLHCPILGDPIYGQPKRQKVKVERLLLHAQQLAFTHPVTMKRLLFEAPLPSAFDAFL